MVERVPTVRVCSNNGGFPADGWSPVLVARENEKDLSKCVSYCGVGNRHICTKHKRCEMALADN